MFSAAISRRRCLAGLVSAGAAAVVPLQAAERKAQVAITLDLEMSRNFPTWETTHWDYEKGNLNAETIAYAVEAGRRVKERGGRVHYFVVGRTLEQADITWLKSLAGDGHPLGNHTYDHINIRATDVANLQFRFQRAPWLIAGRAPADVIRENIALTSAAMRSRLGVEPAGFRTPGGFAEGLAGRDDLQRMLQALGFTWISSKYPRHAVTESHQQPTSAVIESIAQAAAAAQPFRYPTGLIEIPMSPISDIGAFRTGRWKLDWFLAAIRAAAERTIARGGLFDFLGHPSCLYVTDPKFQAIDLLCDLVEQSGGRAELTDLTRCFK